MADNFRCPNCQHELRLPDSSVVKRVRFPHCKQIFTASVESISAEPIAVQPASNAPRDEDAEESPRRGRRAYEDDDVGYDDLDVRKSRRPMPHNYLTESILV